MLSEKEIMIALEKNVLTQGGSFHGEGESSLELGRKEVSQQQGEQRQAG